MKGDLKEQGWKKMEVLLDQHMPVNKKRPIAFFLWIAGATILGILLYLLIINQKSTTIADKNAITSDIIESNNEQLQETSMSLIDELEVESNRTASHNTKTNQEDHKIKDELIEENPKERVQTNSEVPIEIKRKIDPNKRQITPGTSTSLSQIELKPSFAHNDQQSPEAQMPASHIEANQGEAMAGSQSEFKLRQTKSEPIETQTASPQKPIQQNAETALNKLDLIGLAYINTTIEPLQLQPTNVKAQATRKETTTQWEVYTYGQLADQATGMGIGLNAYHQFGTRTSISTGAELSYHQLDVSNNGNRSTGGLPETVFADSRSYSSFLSQESVASSEFIASTITVFVPVQFHFEVHPRLRLFSGIKPGIQFSRNLAFPDINTNTSSRNPSIGNNGLTSEDFISQKTIAVVFATGGFNYLINQRLAAGLYYEASLSDLGRGVSYASAETLEGLQAGEIDRDFYSIEKREINPGFLGLRLAYRF